MKKILLIFLFIPFLCLSQETKKPFDFQGLNWGDSKTKVNSTIPDLEETKSGLTKTTVLNFLDASILFELNDNSLKNISCVFKKQHGNENAFIEDFNKVKNILTKKYGAPNIDELNWNNNTFKSDNDRYGLAVSSGHLKYETVWVLHDTKITLNLGSDNSKIMHTLTYHSVKI